MPQFTWESFYQQKKAENMPVVALAPMSGISDSPMRLMAKKFGSDIEFSEFISAAGLHYKEENEKSFRLAQFQERERPYIIQLFGNNPEHFETATKILTERFHPDGFDINFGCPAHSVVNSGAGSALFCEPLKAKQIIETVKKASGGLPTSIKLRAAYKQISAVEFIKSIEGAPYESVTLHMRTYEQLHTGEPNWDRAKELKAILKVPLIINGGINSGEKAKAALEYTGADGVMIAQASLGNPFIFREIKEVLAGKPVTPITVQERIETALEHASLMAEIKGPKFGVIEMRKHLAWYFKGFPNVSELRQKLVRVESLEQLRETLTNADIFVKPDNQVVH